MTPTDPATGIDKAGLGRVLAAAANELDLALSEVQRGQLVDFVELLAYNLTAVRDPCAMLTQHVVDCLAIVHPLLRELAHYSGRRVLDVGSGGGLPGVVLAVAAPDIEVVCVDSVGKKTAFVSQVAAVLHLGNLSALHARVEGLTAQPFDIIVSRAFAALSTFVGVTRHLLTPAGIWMAMKGKMPDDEVAKLAGTAEVFHVERLVIPGLAAQRCLIWMRPRGGPRRPSRSEHTLAADLPAGLPNGLTTDRLS